MAMEIKQMNRVAASIGFFWITMGAASYGSETLVVRYSKFTPREKTNWVNLIISFVHAVIVCSLSMYVVVSPDGTMEEDRVYGSSDMANLICAIAAGYFFFDMGACLTGEKVDPLMVFHHLASFLCYTFVQYQFLAYYAVRLLLYELSTPLLDIREMMLLLGYRNTPQLAKVEKAFGIVFLAARILYGIPLSIGALYDVMNVWWSSNSVHSDFIVVYFIVANVGLNTLNIMWLTKMIRKKQTKTE